MMTPLGICGCGEYAEGRGGGGYFPKLINGWGGGGGGGDRNKRKRGRGGFSGLRKYINDKNANQKICLYMEGDTYLERC